MNDRNLMVLGIFAISLLMGAGVWSWITFFGDNGPKIKEFSVTPETFRFVGGNAQIQAEVTDEQGVGQVTAVLLADDVEVLRVEMVRANSGIRHHIYSGDVLIPANVRTDGNEVEYTLRLAAVDMGGQKSKKETEIQVPAPGVPPAPPD